MPHADPVLPNLGSIRMETSEYFDDSSSRRTAPSFPRVSSFGLDTHREEFDGSYEPTVPMHREEDGAPELGDVSSSSSKRDLNAPQFPSATQRVPTAILVKPAVEDVPADPMLTSSPNVSPTTPVATSNSSGSVRKKQSAQETQQFLVPFPVHVYNAQSDQWHCSCFVQFWFRRDGASVAAQGFYLIDDLTASPALSTTTPGDRAWPYSTDRMFFPLSCITFLYDDDETNDSVEQASRIRTFCGSLSAGLAPSKHTTDAMAHPQLGDVPSDETIGLRYLPSLLLPPVHETRPDGTVMQQDDVNPWDIVTGTPIVDPFEERLLLIRCGTTVEKESLLTKMIEALQSHYASIRPSFDNSGHSRVRDSKEEEFDARTFYRHCMRRVFQMHFVRRLILTGASKQSSMFLTLWVHVPDEECMRNLIQCHNASGTFNKLLVRIRTLVSLKKVRYMSDGFNLDLASITPNIIAMGFPSTGSQALMRNPMEDVLRYFEMFWSNGTWPATKASICAHLDKDQATFMRRDNEAIAAYLSSTVPIRYRIYNLCSERCYPPTRFGGSFERFPSDDHNPPPLAQMMSFCASAEAFLIGNDSKDPNHPGSQMANERVVAIHCKAGKGRTGLMIVALMLYMKLFDSVDAALHHYNTKRTRDGKGITIASQIRFLKYFAHTLSQIGRQLPTKRPIRLRSVSFSPIPWFDMDGGCTPFFQIRVRASGHCHCPIGQRELVSTESDSMIVIYDSQFANGVNGPMPRLESYVGSERATLRINGAELNLTDEVHLAFFNKGGRLLHTEYMFSFWMHTSFVDDRAAVVMFGRDEIDGASKEHREFFDPGFLVEVEYTALAPIVSP